MNSQFVLVSTAAAAAAATATAGVSTVVRAAREQDNTIFLELLSRSCKFLKISPLSWSEKYYCLVLKILKPK